MPTRVRLNQRGFYELRRAAGVRNDLEQRGDRIASAAKGVGNPEADYGVGSQQGAKRPQGRWRVTVFTRNAIAMRSNAKNNSLIKSLDAGRG